MRYLVAFVAPCLLAACTSLPTTSYEQAMLGTWRTPDGKAEKTYFADGRACGWLYIDYEPHDPEHRYTFSSTWKVDGEILVSTVMTSDNADLSPGTTFTDVIESMGPDKYVFRDVEWTESETRIRVPQGAEKHPCVP